MMGHSKTSAARLRGLELDWQCWQLRKAGLSYRQIAKQLGISKSAVGNSIHRTMRRLEGELLQDVTQWQILQLARLERMLAALWPRVLKGDIKANREARGIIDQINKITGVYSPLKLEAQLTPIEFVVNKISGISDESD